VLITLQCQVESVYPKGRCCICVCCNSVYLSCLTEVSWSIVTHKNTSAQGNNHYYGFPQKYSKIQRVWLFTFFKEYFLQSRIPYMVDEFILRDQWSLILKYLELKIPMDVLRGGNSTKISVIHKLTIYPFFKSDQQLCETFKISIVFYISFNKCVEFWMTKCLISILVHIFYSIFKVKYYASNFYNTVFPWKCIWNSFDMLLICVKHQFPSTS